MEKTQALDDEFNQPRMTFQEKMEFYGFIVLIIGLWCCFVFALLEWQRFPIEKHKGEVIAMILVPASIIIVILSVLDCLLKNSKSKLS